MTNKNIFVACDTSNLNHIKKIISQTKTNKLKIIPKFGLQFFYSKNGRVFLQNFKKDFWLDLKINDIPQTSLSAIESLKDLKRCKYITVHASGGLEMLKAVKKKMLLFGATNVDYVEIYDINKVTKPYKIRFNFKIFIAYYLRSTRMIDNI